MPPNTLPATATMALKMAPRPCPSPEIVEDVVVCAPLTAAASRRATRPPREVPCLGCLIVLVNWIPEDGHPFPCSDSEGKSPVPPAKVLSRTIVLTDFPASGKDDKCVRCARRSKSCFGTTLKDETKKARELAAVFNKQPLDLVGGRPPHFPRTPVRCKRLFVLTPVTWTGRNQTRPRRDQRRAGVQLERRGTHVQPL